MGVLYLAVDPRIDRLVAVKLLQTTSQEFHARFMREARAAGRLSHSNIVTVFDVGEHDGAPYIAMEYVPGETLSSLITRRAPLSVHRRLLLMTNLCDGLGYAHRAGIVHRDVKPANLIVSRESGLLKILDFGIARSVESSLTGSGVPIGTLNYMSPEQARGETIDHRSDIFAVGVVLYELLTYKQAFPGENQHAVLRAIVDGTFEPLLAVNPDLDPALQQVVSRAVAKLPADRYADLRAMQADLTRVLQRLEDAQGAHTVVELLAPAPGMEPESRVAPTGYRGRIAELRAQRVAEHLSRASAALDGGDLAAAQAAVDEAAIVDLDDPRVGALLDRLAQADSEQRARGMLTQAEARLAGQELTAAIDLIDDALRLTPRAEPLIAARQRVEQAVTSRERERLIRSTVDDARAMLEAGAVESALRTVREVLAWAPDHIDARTVRDQAVAVIEERRARDEQNRRVRQEVDQARAMFDEGRADAALAHLGTLDAAHPLVAETIAAFTARREAAEARTKLLAWVDEAIAAARLVLRDATDATAESMLQGALDRLAAAATAPGLAGEVDRARRLVWREQELAVLVRRARDRLAADDYPGALGWLDAVFALEPEHAIAIGLRDSAEQAWEDAERGRRREALERLVRDTIDAADQDYARGQLTAAIARLERVGSTRPDVLDRLARWRAEL